MLDKRFFHTILTIIVYSAAYEFYVAYMKQYTGNEVVILDDDNVEFSPTSLHVQQLQECITHIMGRHITVEVATTPQQWMQVHEAAGTPLLVLHDWDISNLHTMQHYFPYTVSSSIKALLDKGIPVALYTSGTLDYARRKFFSFEHLLYIQKGDLEQVAFVLAIKK